MAHRARRAPAEATGRHLLCLDAGPMFQLGRQRRATGARRPLESHTIPTPAMLRPCLSLLRRAAPTLLALALTPAAQARTRNRRSASARSTATRPSPPSWDRTRRLAAGAGAGQRRRRRARPQAGGDLARRQRQPRRLGACRAGAAGARKVELLFGGFLSNTGLALTDFAKQQQVFFLAAEPLTDKITWQEGNRYTYRLRPSTWMHVAALAPALALRKKRWAIVYPTMNTANRRWRPSRP